MPQNLGLRALRGAKRGFRYWLFIAVPVAFWCALQSFGLCSEDLASGITMIFVTLLFIASLPLALFIRLDNFRQDFSIDDWTLLLLIAALTALVNLTAGGALLATLRGWLRHKAAPETHEASRTEASVNGAVRRAKEPKR